MATPLSNGVATLPDGGRLRISCASDEENGTAIMIDHANGDEIVYWDITEWRNDPECAQAICEAITLAVWQGASAVCRQIGTCQSCRQRAEEG